MSLSDERARALARFDENLKTERRRLSLLVAPLLAFGVFVVLPFAHQANGVEHLVIRADSTHARLASARSRLALLEGAAGVLGDLDFRAHLAEEQQARAHIAEALTSEAVDTTLVHRWASGTHRVDLRETSAFELLDAIDVPSPCIWLDDRQWRECFQVSPYPLCVGRGCLVYPDSALHPQLRRPVPDGFAGELLDSMRAVQRAVAEDLMSVRVSLDTQVPVYGEDELAASAPWVGLANKIDTSRDDLESRMERLRLDSTSIAAEVGRIRSIIESIETATAGINTPIGPLPLGIREIIFLFPGLLGVAIALWGLSQSHSIALRAHVHGLSRRPAEEEAPTADRHLRMVTPLWLDPLLPRITLLLRGIAAVVPAVVMVWTWMSLRSLRIGEYGFGEGTRYTTGSYDLFFAASLVAVLCVGGVVVWRLLSYDRHVGASKQADENDGGRIPVK